MFFCRAERCNGAERSGDCGETQATPSAFQRDPLFQRRVVQHLKKTYDGLALAGKR